MESVVIEKPYIPMVTASECRRVFLEDILYIETIERKIIIHTLECRYSFYGKINNLEKYLDSRFTHCLKSLVVNFDMVISMKSGTIYLYGGKTLLIGQHNFIKAKQRYAYYIMHTTKNTSKVAETGNEFKSKT